MYKKKKLNETKTDTALITGNGRTGDARVFFDLSAPSQEFFFYYYYTKIKL